MESVRPVTAITGSNKFRALAEFLNFSFSDAISRFLSLLDRCAALKNVAKGSCAYSFRKRNVCLVRAPLRKLAEPADIAAAIAFLAGPAATMITGHTLAVDGGFLAQ